MRRDRKRRTSYKKLRTHCESNKCAKSWINPTAHAKLIKHMAQKEGEPKHGDVLLEKRDRVFFKKK